MISHSSWPRRLLRPHKIAVWLKLPLLNYRCACLLTCKQSFGCAALPRRLFWFCRFHIPSLALHCMRIHRSNASAVRNTYLQAFWIEVHSWQNIALNIILWVEAIHLYGCCAILYSKLNTFRCIQTASSPYWIQWSVWILLCVVIVFSCKLNLIEMEHFCHRLVLPYNKFSTSTIINDLLLYFVQNNKYW